MVKSDKTNREKREENIICDIVMGSRKGRILMAKSMASIVADNEDEKKKVSLNLHEYIAERMKMRKWVNHLRTNRKRR
jgi:hypothetical protein